MKVSSQGRVFVRIPMLAGLLLSSALLFPFIGCSTSAVAIDQCREVESLRCEVSVACGIVEQGRVEECKRFYNDQCLHGIAGPEAPSADQQNRCLERITEEGDLAAEAYLKEKLAEAEKELAETDEEREIAEEKRLAAKRDRLEACLVIAVPSATDDCSYLGPERDGMGGSAQESE